MAKWHKIVTLHENADDANSAKGSLLDAGFNENDITIDNLETLGGVEVIDVPEVWVALFGPDVEEYEAKTYSQTVKDGASVLTVRATEDDAPRAVEVLHNTNAVDVTDKAVDEGIISAKAADTIPHALRLAREEIAVGKKLYETGTTRIRRFVTEKEVSDSVTLHSEHVEVVNTALDDPNVTDYDWGEATIELRETTERPYVIKSAKIVGEVNLKKVGEDRTETVTETVRQTNFKVEEDQDNPEVFVEDEGIVDEHIN